ncbi:DUF4240 domain-containing protein [Actinotalea sp. Marseille-Q4924]|uniref:DUF4240 domain-containing protein n=1 Tax=Actinotalea sp. Marseille-Q4924 TaxID=2866571 RepID=UPI001CE3CE10|nr:DUF4240 domain-containing protein [Actinotalea sp. Marseille-Q4924]
MNPTELWDFVETARDEVEDPTDTDAVVEALAAQLAERGPEDVLAFDAALSHLLADSYTTDLWAAAYLVNGGASDDGFDYFRGWLVAQGRDTFESAVGEPDSLADVPAVRAAMAAGEELESEAMLAVAWDVYESLTGDELPDTDRAALPQLEAMWDFDDEHEMRVRLPRLAALAYDED